MISQTKSIVNLNCYLFDHLQEDDLENVIKEITDEWEKCQPTCDVAPTEAEDVDTKLARLLETKHITTTVQRQYTEEELKIREQILSQYSQVEYDDEYDEENDEAAAGPSTNTTHSTNDPLLVKNTNAADVAALAKERREQAKIDSKAKKDKDKMDREKQKQLREEKKEKRKTVKGERRR